MARYFDFMEPAHPAAIQQFKEYVELFRELRAQQEAIDHAFDFASRQIGFVVTTALPVRLRIVRGAREVELGKGLAGTIFEGAFAKVLDVLKAPPRGAKGAEATPSDGVFELYLVWHEALKLKLRVDWMEPAHIAIARQPELAAAPAAVAARAASARVRPEVMEPAHWFDIGVALDTQDEMVIAAIDEVYPDLRLAEHVAAARREARGYVPGIKEPAHFRELLEVVLDRIGPARRSPGGGDPPHRTTVDELLGRPDAAALIAELTAVLRKFGA